MVRPPIRVSESPGPGDPDPGHPDPSGVEPGTAAVRFRPLTAADLPLLGRWLAAPHVHRWWHHETDMAALERDFGPTMRGEEPGEDLLVLLESDGRTRPVGLVQRCRWHDYPEYVDEIAPSLAIPAGALAQSPPASPTGGSEASPGAGASPAAGGQIATTIEPPAEGAAITVWNPFTGPDLRWMLPYTAVLAPVLLLGADVLGRVLGSPGELQVGTVTAVLGGPLFLYLVRAAK